VLGSGARRTFIRLFIQQHLGSRQRLRRGQPRDAFVILLKKGKIIAIVRLFLLALGRLCGSEHWRRRRPRGSLRARQCRHGILVPSRFCPRGGRGSKPERQSRGRG